MTDVGSGRCGGARLHTNAPAHFRLGPVIFRQLPDSRTSEARQLSEEFCLCGRLRLRFGGT